MINPKDRFWIESIQICGNTTSTNVVDWDQRRMFTIISPANPDGADIEVELLEGFIDQIDSNVYKLTVDDQGSLISVSSDPEDDPTVAINYLNYFDVPSLKDCPTIGLSKLTEVDRLGPTVDLMSYVNDSGSEENVVFKYIIVFQRIRNIWNELHIIKTLPKHPHLVPFDRVVVDDMNSKVLGFTTTYFPGETLDESRSQVFRLSWLQQLTAVVDYLNLERGIIHQDIAPRNLLVDPENNLRLFDFDRAAYIGQSGIVAERNDIAGVIFTLYELITQDDLWRNGPTRPDPTNVLNLDDWPLKCQLDTDLVLFRQHLNDWVQQRRERQQVAHVQQPQVPPMPVPRPVINGFDEAGKPICESIFTQMRVDALKFKQHVVSWERPPYCKAYAYGLGRSA